MLNKVRVRNFKCLREVDVDLTPLTVLIGPNDSGKSSFLSCLQGLGKLSDMGYDPALLASYLRSNRWRLDQSLGVSIEASSENPDFSLSFEALPAGRIENLRIGADTASSSIAQGKTVDVRFRDKRWKSNGIRSILSGVLETAGGAPIDDAQAVQKNLSISEPYHLSPTEMRKPAMAQPKPMLSARGDNLAVVVNALMTGPDRPAVTELEHSLHAAIPTLRGIATPPLPSQSNKPTHYELKFALSGNERPPLTIPASEVSDGAMFLTAFLTLIHAQSNQVLLIEEPENGLHPSRLQTVVDLLRKVTTGELGYPPRQIVLTTHSPVLLNCVTPGEVRIFQRGKDGASSVIRMDQVPDIERLSKEFAPGEMWFLFGEEDLVQKSSK